MACGCFTDRADAPDLDRAKQVLGAARLLWDELLAAIREETRAAPAWRFYGRNHGWALAFRKGGRALAAAFPDEGGYTALVVLAAAQADAAVADLGVSERLRAHIAGLSRFKEGCWVFVRVATRDDVGDALSLIRIRAGRPAREG